LIRVSNENEVYHHNNISYVSSPVVSKSDTKELHFWSTDPLESPSGDLFTNIVRKSHFIRVFEQLLPSLGLTGEERVLEIGGGHCWASALIKRNYPGCYVVASDLSPEAVQFVENYEGLLGTKVDEKWAFNCRRIPFDDEQFDMVFTFAAFHHFGEERDFSEALREMVRILRPGGKLILLYEPSSPRWTYKLAFERANRKRASFSHEIDENVLVLADIKRICKKLGCKFQAQYFTSYEHREGIVETVYYYSLTRMKPLQRLLPCTVNVTIQKI